MGDSVSNTRMNGRTKDGQHVPQKLFRDKRGTRERTRNIDTLHMSSHQNAHEFERHGPNKQSRVTKSNHVVHASQSLGHKERTRVHKQRTREANCGG